MKHFYFVSLEAMTVRVEQLGLIPKGTWESLKESGFAPSKAEATLGLPSPPVADEIVPERYKYLAVHAYERGDLGDGRPKGDPGRPAGRLDRRLVPRTGQGGVDATRPDSASVVQVLNDIQILSQFRPNPSTPDSDWWFRRRDQ